MANLATPPPDYEPRIAMPTSPPNEDLFEDSRMSFGEHLEELRKVLVRSVIGIGIGCIIGFFFANRVVEFLNRPLENAISNFHIKQAEQRLIVQNGFLDPEAAPWLQQDNLAPETVYVDPGEIVQLLRQVSPDFLSGVELQPYGFQAGHFDEENLPAVARRLSTQEGALEGQQSRLTWMWENLDPGQQAVVQRIASAPEGTADQVATMIAIFDQLADQRLSDAAPFAEYFAPAADGWTSFFVPAQSNPLQNIKQSLNAQFQPDLNRRLNRVLITDQFADLMPPIRKDMMPIQMWSRINVQPQSLTAIEPFLIWVKAGLILGLVLSSPWVFYQLWSFVAAGLYPHEQKYVYVFLPVSLLLFFSGVLLAFVFVFEPVLTFLFSFNAQMGISPQPRITEWLNFVLLLPVGFGIAFQLPLVMLFLNRIGLVEEVTYREKWRVAIMIIFVVAMMLTPADPVSMILLAVPLTGLYFLGIGLCRWFPRQQNPFERPTATAPTN